ncbi:MAG: mechanosensitive ion channel [Candidatus Marinimicrobia bacterium]|nr:mechanosensitive ion channel [Candidatus Neomarinimicrobiota bacterium]
MNAWQQFNEGVVQTLGNNLPKVLGAVIVLVVGWVAARLLKGLVVALLGKLAVDQRLEKRMGKPARLESFLGTLVYYVVLVYVLILALGVLGIEGVLEPLNEMFSRLVSIVPSIAAALLLGVLGYFVARICGNVVTAVTSGADTLMSRTKLPESFSPSRLLGQLTFIFVWVPILIAALEALQIEAIAGPATEMLATLLAAIPQILAAALILAVAYIVGRFVADFLGTFLANLGVNDLPAKVGMDKLLGSVTLSQAFAAVALFFIMLAALISAASKLGLALLADILASLLVFGGNVALGLVILGLGAWIAQLAHTALSRTAAKGAVAEIARAAILVLVLAMGLRAMGIAEDIVTLAFLLGLGAIAVAFALSFGLGGRDAAGRQMDDWFKKLRKEE